MAQAFGRGPRVGHAVGALGLQQGLVRRGLGRPGGGAAGLRRWKAGGLMAGLTLARHPATQKITGAGLGRDGRAGHARTFRAGTGRQHGRGGRARQRRRRGRAFGTRSLLQLLRLIQLARQRLHQQFHLQARCRAGPVDTRHAHGTALRTTCSGMSAWERPGALMSDSAFAARSAQQPRHRAGPRRPTTPASPLASAAGR